MVRAWLRVRTCVSCVCMCMHARTCVHKDMCVQLHALPALGVWRTRGPPCPRAYMRGAPTLSSLHMRPLTGDPDRDCGGLSSLPPGCCVRLPASLRRCACTTLRQACRACVRSASRPTQPQPQARTRARWRCLLRRCVAAPVEGVRIWIDAAPWRMMHGGGACAGWLTTLAYVPCGALAPARPLQCGTGGSTLQCGTGGSMLQCGTGGSTLAWTPRTGMGPSALQR